jgi:hypothetical protein
MRTALLFLATLLLAAEPGGAKTVCGQLGDPDGRFYVIYKVKTKVGALGPVHGYFITQAGVGIPFSGHYSVQPDGRLRLTTSDAGSPGVAPATNLRNWTAPVAAGDENGNQVGTNVDGDLGTVSEIAATSTSFEPCANVPKFGSSN